MTQDTEQEPTEPTVADVPEPDQPGPDETEEEEAHEAEQAAHEQAEASGPPVDAAKEQRRIASALTREQDAHGRKLEKILGEAHEHVLPCPVCFEGLQGYVFPADGAMLDDERRDAVLAFVGATPTRVLKSAVAVKECDQCDGWGQLAYPTKVPHVQEQTCPKCAGSGYVPEQQVPSNVAPITGTAPPPPPIAYGEVAPCPICGAPNSAGKPHFCNPVAAAGT